jgi:S1-C subfamily serine protease
VTRRKPFAAALLVGAALSVVAIFGVAGCGDDDDGGTKTVTETTATSGNGSAAGAVVAASNGDFDPAAIYKKAAPGVVTILSLFGGGSANPLESAGGGQGSGFVISKEGEILTNAHVVTSGGEGAASSPTGPTKIQAADEVFVDFADGNRVEAEIVGFDPDADVALIKVDPKGLDLVPLALSDGKNVSIGEPVAAIGSPFGEERSLSIGVVSATDRAINSLSKFSIDGAIQTDAAINPGNSGGPLLNGGAQVIGINQQIESGTGANSGVGFAVPMSAVQYSLEQLRDSGKVEYAFIGVTTQTLYPQLAEELGIDTEDGALITEVSPGSPAEKAGLKGGKDKLRFQASEVVKGGDTIVAIDGDRVTSSSDVARLVANDRPGQTVTFEVVRGREHRDVQVTLAPRPAN